MLTAFWWVFSYHCVTYQHLSTGTELFCFFFFLPSLFFFWTYTRNENHHKVSSFRKFSFFILGTPLIYNQLLSPCNHYFTSQAPCSLPLWQIAIGGVPLGSGHGNGGIHWSSSLSLFLNPLFFFLTQTLSSPTDTVLMLVTYHRNFCSHHGHHLCRGKIGDMMAFPLSQLRAQSSPTSPPVCTPARVCDYGGNVSHDECVSLWH